MGYFRSVLGSTEKRTKVKKAFDPKGRARNGHLRGRRRDEIRTKGSYFMRIYETVGIGHLQLDIRFWGVFSARYIPIKPCSL